MEAWHFWMNCELGYKRQQPHPGWRPIVWSVISPAKSMVAAGGGSRQNANRGRVVPLRLSRSFSMGALPVGGHDQFRMRDGALIGHRSSGVA